MLLKWLSAIRRTYRKVSFERRTRRQHRKEGLVPGKKRMKLLPAVSLSLALAALGGSTLIQNVAAQNTTPHTGKPGTKIHGRFLGVTHPGHTLLSLPPHARKAEIPFHPLLHNKALTMKEYEALKTKPTSAFGARNGRNSAFGEDSFSSSASLLSSTGFLYTGPGLNQSQAGGWYPSDCSLAVGPNFAVEPSNSAVAIYSKTLTDSTASLTQLSITDANSFMNWSVVQGVDPNGNTNFSSAFDPRAIYDERGKRFIITYDAFSYVDANGVYHSPMLIAVSKSGDATGAWDTYEIDMASFITTDPVNNPTPFLDFPSLGIDDSSLYITADVIGNTYAQGATLFTVNRTDLESGILHGYLWNGLNGSLTPPHVRTSGTNGSSYFVFSQPYSASVGMYALTGGTRPVLSSAYSITVPYYEIPPNAIQPGGATLDTLDSRFQDKTAQVGDSVYAVHCVSSNSYPTVRAYELDGYQETVKQTIDCYRSATSDDFNPSITANDNGSVAINWNFTDIGTRTHPLTNYETIAIATLSGKKPWATHTKGKPVAGSDSTIARYNFRNGDYSMLVVDPTNPLVAWGINMNTADYYVWQNYIFGFKLTK